MRTDNMYEKYDSGHRPGLRLEGLCVRAATGGDVRGIAEINAERTKGDLALAIRKVSEEVVRSAAGGDFRMFAAAVGLEVVGFARCVFFDTDIKPVKFPSPSGWYGLGLVVRKEFRGKGVARALSECRIEWLKPRAEYLYSFASSENPVSLKMHKEFGFEEVTTAPGFLNVDFDCGKGVLFRRKICKQH